MTVVYQICCGIDVHKPFLVATIIKTTSRAEPSYLKKRFSTFNNSILQFKEWLIENKCRDVCMESTGKYRVPVFNLLEDEINVTVAKLTSCRSSEKNRSQNALTVCNGALDSVVSDLIAPYENAVQFLCTYA